MTYKSLLNLYSPIVFEPSWDCGILNGITLKQYLKELQLDTWQGRIRYYRLKNNITANEVAKKIGMQNGTSYLKKYENACKDYYTSVSNYKAVCDAIGIKYEDIADDYMLFIDSDYDMKLATAIEKTGLSSKEFAEKYNIEYTTLRHSLKRMHKLSIKSYEKYKKIFEELNI
ncbi:helix-turn-helix domain-containing protein [Roseburia sp. MSJ-14]|uniref:helix-turn-helix domain-containing protein n=1 Tax=Roseburia sp. MSJ-14 TaxID=2841514 RepID=UPI001C120DEE|nr:helix-turn-helix transcriptional regulator [Roseburia sp. MSJ-14]MBU5473607.1 helix-turn-helix transcriptional regulator [Roseburia sp. MSJ-14]